jgi:hypothetical protein
VEEAARAGGDGDTSPLTACILVHSPIVGPDSWWPVADELERRGIQAVVPDLIDDGTPPFWRQHVRSAVQAIAQDIAPGVSLVLVAHSGAGQLLGVLGPVLSDAGYRVACYVLADAALPPPNISRVEQLEIDSPAVAVELHELFEQGETFPNWTDEMLRPLVPHDERRARLIDGIRRQPHSFWSEPIPTALHWPDAPVGVLLFSDAYRPTAVMAAQQQWPLADMEAGNHFVGLVDESGVTDHLLDLIAILIPSDALGGDVGRLSGR